MVRKLLKYDFAAFAKTILPMEIVLIAIALITRIIQFFETDGHAYEIFSVSSIVLLVIAMLVSVVMTEVVCITRFYKNLYTAEGYLTLTLPATHAQHNFSKLITAVCANIFALISLFVATAISTAGEVFHEIIKAIAYLAKLYFKFFKVNGGLYIVESVILIIAMCASFFLLIYTCITVGQMAKTKRVLAAFGVYFGYYIFNQILGTIAIILYTNYGGLIFTDAVREWIDKNYSGTIHIIFISLILINVILSVVFFLITRVLMKKKLNIE